MALTALEFLKNYKWKDYPDGTCTICNKVMMHSDAVEKTSTGYAHSGCYWNALSDLVESSPIRTPRIRRG